MSQLRRALSRPPSISPPPKRRRLTEDHPNYTLEGTTPVLEVSNGTNKAAESPNTRYIASPVQLNFVDQLPPASNVDTISLGSILGDVMIRECWLFNYLFDLDFVMSQFDPDIKMIVKVHVVHGSWRKEDLNKITLDEAAKRYPNVNVTTAYMPEAFGTHHSKMAVLFRHDDLAQVIILTGNFIQRDWSMSQAIWKSPLLPLLRTNPAPYSPTAAPLGSGSRFKYDLTAYIREYGARLKDLAAHLGEYDFSEIRAALVASKPGKQNLHSTDPDTETLWGWPGLRHVLSSIPTQTRHVGHAEETANPKDPQRDTSPQIIIQVSSVASIGGKWLSTTLLPALGARKQSTTQIPPNLEPGKPRYSIVFPTAETIRKSVGGYSSGASIHMKTQTPAQAKQLSDIRPMLCHWAKDPNHAGQAQAAGRGRAAPHIKTYTRFSDASQTHIDWAMVTSANLSTQAWGGAVSASGEVRICSYEIGVVVWPALWNEAEDGDRKAEMVPVFGRDTPSVEQDSDYARAERGVRVMFSDHVAPKYEGGGRGKGAEPRRKRTIVGWRMPYDLPLVPYGREDMPWCATEPCTEPDWMGRVWLGHGK